MSSSSYRDYLLREWEIFATDASRGTAAHAIRRHIGPIQRVLDVGCGAGQDLRPFVGDARCFGIDMAAESPILARELARELPAPAQPAFARGAAEALPIRSGQIDLVISRLVLPYTHVVLAIEEIARVLRLGGGLSVQMHSPRYYLRKASRAIVQRDRRSLAYAFRVLRTGIAFRVSGQQRAVRGTLETFLTVRQLQRIAAAARLDFVMRIENGNPRAPHLLFQRR